MIQLLQSLIMLVAATISTASATASSRQVANKAAEVYIGIYANQLLGMSIKDNNSDIGYYLWLRWKHSGYSANRKIQIDGSKPNQKSVHHPTLSLDLMHS